MDIERCNIDWFTIALPSIYYISRLNALQNNRFNVEKQDILIAIKRYKYGYTGFYPPPVVLSVYENVFIEC